MKTTEIIKFAEEIGRYFWEQAMADRKAELIRQEEFKREWKEATRGKDVIITNSET